jgi:CRP-like cAMP-binding protein
MKKFLRQHIEKFSPLTDEEFDFVFSHFTLKKLKKGDLLIREGEEVSNHHLVFSGCLKAYHIDNLNRIHVIRFALKDWWITDFEAFYMKTKATLTVDCIEDCELLCLSHENRTKLCKEIHAIEHFFHQKLTFSFVTLHQRVLSLLNNNAKERYETMIQQYPEIIQKVPKHLIASYLGVTRETLSRLYLQGK